MDEVIGEVVVEMTADVVGSWGTSSNEEKKKTL